MWCEHSYPSSISAPSQPSQGTFIDLNDRRSTVITLDQKRDKELLELQKLTKVADGEVGDIVRQGMKTTKETRSDLISFMVVSMVAMLGSGLGVSWFVIPKLVPDP